MTLCAMKILQPAMVTAPKRIVVPVLGANCKVSVPLPVPDAAPLKVIHDTVAVALHAQPAGAVIVTVSVPAATVMLTGVTR